MSLNDVGRAWQMAHRHLTQSAATRFTPAPGLQGVVLRCRKLCPYHAVINRCLKTRLLQAHRVLCYGAVNSDRQFFQQNFIVEGNFHQPIGMERKFAFATPLFHWVFTYPDINKSHARIFAQKLSLESENFSVVIK